MIKDKQNIFGCFTSGPATIYDANKTEQERLAEQENKSAIGKLFRGYIWGNESLDDTLKMLKHEDYGKDLVLTLFKFYLNPISYELAHLKLIENYRKNEKSIGIPIIINDENFFNKSELERYDFLKQSILQKLDLLEEVVKKKKLDTNMDLLKSDLKRIFEEI